jgi:hypothetical protein
VAFVSKEEFLPRSQAHGIQQRAIETMTAMIR